LEYEFIVVYKHGKTHVVVNVISMLLNSLEPLGVPDQTMDARSENLFKDGKMSKTLNLA
jgi:hypothetical protein